LSPEALLITILEMIHANFQRYLFRKRPPRRLPRALATLLLIVPVLLLPAPGHAEETADTETILIRGVILPAGADQKESISVNILIRNRKLSVVTRDEIPSSEATLVFDAQGGIALGRLTIGEPASFLILNRDPRENVEVLLDTRSHTRFAIYEGDILLNKLSRESEVDSLASKKTEKERMAGLHATAYGAAVVLYGRDEVEPLGYEVCLWHFPRRGLSGQDFLALPGCRQ